MDVMSLTNQALYIQCTGIYISGWLSELSLKSKQYLCCHHGQCVQMDVTSLKNEALS
jgi:hypothetical protein